MTSSSSSRLVLAILANVVLAATACGGFSGDSGSAAPAAAEPAVDGQAPPADVDASDAGPKAPPVEGPANVSELTDDLGIFVTTSGNDTASGTHDHPLATIQAGIDKAKTVGKRVYVCTGTFKEALTLADSISIIGGLDCTANVWNTGTGRSRVEAPTSPALRAKDINSATRIEGFDVVAPSATVPSGSSIGLYADHAPKVVVARSQIVAGNAMKGTDGTEGIQLSNSAFASGAQVPGGVKCTLGVGGATCERSVAANDWAVPSGGAAGTNSCDGAPGYAAESGGRGGSGGLYQWGTTTVLGSQIPTLKVYKGSAAFATTTTPDSRVGMNAPDGTDGTGGPLVGTASPDGYVPADGTAGTNGGKGFGGSGGNGVKPGSEASVEDGTIWRGWGGAGGGAGGCPGLAGTAGKGGGASIAALLIESPITFDAAELLSGKGGAGGAGTFGSLATAGGAAGKNARADLPALNAGPGGNGGDAGISGNGGSGPSLGVAHKGAAPVIIGGTKITPGAGGAAIDARSRLSPLSGLNKTIPATPVGTSKDILPLP